MHCECVGRRAPARNHSLDLCECRGVRPTQARTNRRGAGWSPRRPIVGRGRRPHSLGRTRAIVGQLREELARTGVDELIRLHPSSTRSHAKFAIADRQGRAPVALLGSCNWLSSSMQLIEATVRLRDAAIVSDLLFQAAELSCGGTAIGPS